MQKRYFSLLAFFLYIISVAAQNATLPDSVQTKTIEKQLHEVEITERKAATSPLSIFKSVSISTKASAPNLTTAEVLQQIPSLSADIEGNLRLRGSNRVSLLYHGVPLTLFEENRSDLLIQLPVNLFTLIQTYNIPPIEWINEGDAGVVNFLFSPDFSGNSILKMTLGAGVNKRCNASWLAGTKIGKLHIQAGYSYRQEYRYRSYQKTTVDNTGVASQSNNASAWPQTHLALLSAQYRLSSSDIFDFNGLFHTMNYTRLGNINNTKTNTAGVVVNNLIRQRDNSEKQTGLSDGLHWVHTWSEQKMALDASLNYDKFDYNQKNNYANRKPGSETILAQDRLFITQNKQQWFATAKLTKQFCDALSANAGYTGQWHRDGYLALDDDLTSAVWQSNASKSNNYHIDKSVQMGFAELQFKAQRWRGQIGLQTEFEQRESFRTEDIIHANQHKNYLLPHFELNYRSSNSSLWTLSYEERINRPVLSDLNPYTDRSDVTYIHQGNQQLENEHVQVAELSNQFQLKGLTVNPVLFYRFRKNQIVDFATIINNETVWSKQNSDHAQDIGVELNIRWSPVTCLLAEVSATGYHYQIDGARQGLGTKGKYSIDTKGSVKWSLPLNLILQVDGYSIDKQLTAQGEIAPLFCINSSLSYSHQHLSCALTVGNLFDSIEEKTTFNTMGTQQSIYRNRDARVTWLSISYQL